MTEKQKYSAIVCTACGIGIIICLLLAVIFPPKPESQGPPEPITEEQRGTEASFDDLLDAIEWVESGGDANAIGDGGNAIGAFQIHKIYVDDLNRIYKLQHLDKYSTPLRWTYYHRKSKVCSRIMVRDYLKHYATENRLGHRPTFEDMARIHNGGPNGYQKESTKKYWQKVKARLEAVK